MLRGLDKVLMWLGWIGAAILVVMLLLGRAVMGEDDNSPGPRAAGAAVWGWGGGANGAVVFKANCGPCHTLSAAGTTGAVGPNLDNVSLSVSEIEATVRN